MRKWKLERDWALLTALSWQMTARFQPKSAVAEADAFSIAPLANFFFFWSYTWFYLRNCRFSLFLTQRNLAQDNAQQPWLELFHFHKQLETCYLWREQSLSFNQCLLSAFYAPHTILETRDIAVNTNKTYFFNCFQGAVGQRVSQIIN